MDVQQAYSFIILNLILIVFGTGLTNRTNELSTSCRVEVILQKVDTGMYTYVLDSYGELHESATILQPANIQEGTYRVTATHESSNLYSIDGQSYYLKTTACYEYEYYTDAILQVVNYGDISSGELTFK